MELKKRVYNKLKGVPKGKVITYKEIARAVNSKAYRFVGMCMKHNKDPKNIPCYKVVKSNGEIGNYSAPGGINKKISLLKLDGIRVTNKRVNLKRYGYKFT